MTTINIPERNRAVKKLLEQTYPGVKVSVTAGRGTAYHWIKIELDERVGNPPGMVHNNVTDAITDLIIGAGIYIHSHIGDCEYTGKCIDITMPHKQRGDLVRNAIAQTIARMMERSWPDAKVTESATTSDCPLITLTFENGEAFNITITRARK